jgi:hypothetical protein
MTEGLKSLLSSFERYTILVKRPGSDWDPGKAQSTALLLDQDDQVIADGSIDPRLLKGRAIKVVGVTPDKGMATVSLSTRRVEALARSEQIIQAIEALNDHMLAGARLRWFTPGAAGAMIVAPLFAAFVPFIIDTGEPWLTHSGGPPPSASRPTPSTSRRPSRSKTAPSRWSPKGNGRSSGPSRTAFVTSHHWT